MIGEILFTWNELTVILAVWLLTVALLWVADFGPEIAQEKMAGKTIKGSLGIKSPASVVNSPILTKVYDLDHVYPIHGKHAKR